MEILLTLFSMPSALCPLPTVVNGLPELNFSTHSVVEIVTDVLIIGGGGAGCMAAIGADRSKNVSVAIVEKGVIGASGCTVMGTYSCCAALGYADPRDNPEVHFEDTFVGGAELADQALLTRFVEDAPLRVLELVEYGVPFEKEGGRLKQGDMPGHTYPRACFVGNRTGQAMQWGLRKKLRQTPGVKRYHDVQIYRLLHHSGTVYGAAGFCRKTLTPIRFVAKATVIATGGCGQLYPYTSTSLDNTGNGISMALDAGAMLMDMEFMQFNPVCYIYPRLIGLNRTQTRFLRFVPGSRMLNRLGRDFVADTYPDWKHSLTRDKLSQLIYQEVLEGRGSEHGGVYIDLSQSSEGDIEKALSVGNFRKKIKKMNIDLRETRFEVGPASHYFMGGIRIGVDGGTSLPGLYAAGEAAAGIHGGNRLAGNALSEILVTGTGAGQAAANYAAVRTGAVPDFSKKTEWEDWIERLFSREKAEIRPVEMKQRLQEMMWKYAGVKRIGTGLKKGLADIADIRLSLLDRTGISSESMPYHMELHDAVETRLMLDAAEGILTSALLRKESRGAHFREDIPYSDKEWKTNLVVTREGGSLKCEKI